MSNNEVLKRQEELLLQVDKLTELEVDYAKKLEDLLENKGGKSNDKRIKKYN